MIFDRLLNLWYMINVIPLDQKCKEISRILTVQMVVVLTFLSYLIYLTVWVDGNNTMEMLFASMIIFPVSFALEIYAHSKRTDDPK